MIYLRFHRAWTRVIFHSIQTQEKWLEQIGRRRGAGSVSWPLFIFLHEQLNEMRSCSFHRARLKIWDLDYLQMQITFFHFCVNGECERWTSWWSRKHHSPSSILFLLSLSLLILTWVSLTLLPTPYTGLADDPKYSPPNASNMIKFPFVVSNESRLSIAWPSARKSRPTTHGNSHMGRRNWKYFQGANCSVFFPHWTLGESWI